MTIEERIAWLESLAKANDLHEPSCALLLHRRHVERDQTAGVFVEYWSIPDCDCWLSRSGT